MNRSDQSSASSEQIQAFSQLAIELKKSSQGMQLISKLMDAFLKMSVEDKKNGKAEKIILECLEDEKLNVPKKIITNETKIPLERKYPVPHDHKTKDTPFLEDQYGPTSDLEDQCYLPPDGVQLDKFMSFCMSGSSSGKEKRLDAFINYLSHREEPWKEFGIGVDQLNSFLNWGGDLLITKLIEKLGQFPWDDFEYFKVSPHFSIAKYASKISLAYIGYSLIFRWISMPVISLDAIDKFIDKLLNLPELRRHVSEISNQRCYSRAQDLRLLNPLFELLDSGEEEKEKKEIEKKEIEKKEIEERIEYVVKKRLDVFDLTHRVRPKSKLKPSLLETLYRFNDPEKLFSNPDDGFATICYAIKNKCSFDTIKKLFPERHFFGKAQELVNYSRDEPSLDPFSPFPRTVNLLAYVLENWHHDDFIPMVQLLFACGGFLTSECLKNIKVLKKEKQKAILLSIPTDQPLWDPRSNAGTAVLAYLIEMQYPFDKMQQLLSTEDANQSLTAKLIQTALNYRGEEYQHYGDKLIDFFIKKEVTPSAQLFLEIHEISTDLALRLLTPKALKKACKDPQEGLKLLNCLIEEKVPNEYINGILDAEDQEAVATMLPRIFEEDTEFDACKNYLCNYKPIRTILYCLLQKRDLLPEQKKVLSSTKVSDLDSFLQLHNILKASTVEKIFNQIYRILKMIITMYYFLPEINFFIHYFNRLTHRNILNYEFTHSDIPNDKFSHSVLSIKEYLYQTILRLNQLDVEYVLEILNSFFARGQKIYNDDWLLTIEPFAKRLSLSNREKFFRIMLSHDNVLWFTEKFCGVSFQHTLVSLFELGAPFALFDKYKREIKANFGLSINRNKALSAMCLKLTAQNTDYALTLLHSFTKNDVLPDKVRSMTDKKFRVIPHLYKLFLNHEESRQDIIKIISLIGLAPITGIYDQFSEVLPFITWYFSFEIWSLPFINNIKSSTSLEENTIKIILEYMVEPNPDVIQVIVDSFKARACLPSSGFPFVFNQIVTSEPSGICFYESLAAFNSLLPNALIYGKHEIMQGILDTQENQLPERLVSYFSEIKPEGRDSSIARMMEFLQDKTITLNQSQDKSVLRIVVPVSGQPGNFQIDTADSTLKFNLIAGKLKMVTGLVNLYLRLHQGFPVMASFLVYYQNNWLNFLWIAKNGPGNKKEVDVCFEKDLCRKNPKTLEDIFLLIHRTVNDFSILQKTVTDVLDIAYQKFESLKTNQSVSIGDEILEAIHALFLCWKKLCQNQQFQPLFNEKHFLSINSWIVDHKEIPKKLKKCQKLLLAAAKDSIFQKTPSVIKQEGIICIEPTALRST